MKPISLTRGKVATVDDADFEWLARHKWCALKGKRTHYAVRSVYIDGVRQSGFEYMHRAIMGAGMSQDVDHRNGDGLDNRRMNLRIATARQNRQHRLRKPTGCTSHYKGVSWDARRRKWKAAICAGLIGSNGKRAALFLGRYGSETEAAKAYDAAALTHYGEFAALNFPVEQGGRSA